MPEMTPSTPLQTREDFSRPVPADFEEASFATRDSEPVVIPQLPGLEEMKAFWMESNAVVSLPKKDSPSAPTDTIAFDSDAITVKDATALPRLLKKSLDYLVVIDRRFFDHPPTQSTPLEQIEARRDASRELLVLTSQCARLAQRHYAKPPEEVLKTFFSAFQFHLGTDTARLVRTRDQAAYLAAIEMVYDAGIKPILMKPDPNLFRNEGGDASAGKTATPAAPRQPTDEPKQRKVINYGRATPASPTAAPPSGPGAAEPEPLSSAELTRQSQELQAQDLSKSSQQEFEAFHNEVRKTNAPFQRYGKVQPEKATNGSAPAPLALKADSWILHAMAVQAGGRLEPVRTLPLLQEVAMTFANWAARHHAYVENHMEAARRPQWLQSWNFAGLKSEVESQQVSGQLYGRVMEIAQAVSDEARELGLMEKLSPFHQSIVRRLAPRAIDGNIAVTLTPGISMETSLSADAERQLKVQILVRAKQLISRSDNPALKYFSGTEDQRMALAQQIARKEIENPTLLGG